MEYVSTKLTVIFCASVKHAEQIAKGGYTDKDAQRNILSNPFKRFEDMQMLRHTKTLGIIEVESTIWKNLTDDEKSEINEICDVKLNEYYNRLK